MLRRLLVLLPLLALGAGCADQEADGIPACVDVGFELEGCAPLYQPSFENVFVNTLGPRCAPEGASCHANPEASGARPNDLVFADPDGAHAALMGQSEGHDFVDVEEPSCSLLVVRLASDDEDIRMPPGETPVGEAELCAIATWIAEGAER